MKIYYTDVAELSDVPLREQLLLRLPEERRERLLRYRNRADVLRGIAAGILLQYGLYEQGIRSARLIYGPQGKPMLAEGKDIFFNLTHSGSYAAVVFADAPVGIDLEQLGRTRENVAKRFFKQEEQEDLQSYWKGRSDLAAEKADDTRRKTEENVEWQKRFAWLWTRKESYIKAEGEGMRIPMDSFSVLGDCSEEGYFFQSYFVPEGYCMSVCCKNGDAAQIRQVSMDKIDREDRLCTMN